MISRVSANQSTFRDVVFSPGFNLVLAERTAEASDRDSRNGLGKSLLLEIIHFCMGARGTKGRGVVVDALSDWQFRVDLLHEGAELAFSRSVADDDRRWVYVESGFQNWPVEPDEHEGRARFNTLTQNRLLGRMLFGLTAEVEDTKWGPSYRSLISYLMRRGPDGFLDPFIHDRNQQEWDKQVNVGFHLGLNWPDAAAFQELRSEKRVIDQLAKAVREGSLPEYLGSEGALETERVRLQSEIESRVARIGSFEVREDYREIQERANRITEQMHQLVNDNLRDRRYSDLYAERLEQEREAVISNVEVEQLFEEAEVVLPDQVVRRLDEVERFHAAVVENRRAYLADEIARLAVTVDEREERLASLGAEKRDLMRVLESAGALEEYNRLQEMLSEVRARLRDVEARLRRLKEVTEAKAIWERRRSEVLQRSRTRYSELREQRDKAIGLFNANTQALYEGAGRLIIDVNDKGFDFDVTIDRSGSHGVSNMKIFCFDLMLMQLWADRGGGPGLLVHDSALFDGVDERQTAAALELACRESERLGFQYICSLNSDDLPRSELGADSPVLDKVAIELHDRDPSGMLLGMAF